MKYLGYVEEDQKRNLENIRARIFLRLFRIQQSSNRGGMHWLLFSDLLYLINMELEFIHQQRLEMV